MSLMSVNLGDVFEDVDPVQVCRTCPHNADHAWRIPFDKMLRLKGTPELDRLLCTPTHADTAMYVTDAGLIKSSARKFETTVSGLVSTCGQQILGKCVSCARFDAVKMSVPTQYYEGGPIRQKQVLVGGHCSIPADGIIVNGKKLTCSPLPKGIDIDPSCLNCAFRMQTNGATWGSDFDRDVGRMDLTPVEMAEARIVAQNEGRPVSHTITDARKRLLVHPEGIWRWYRGVDVTRITREGLVAIPVTDAKVTNIADGTETAVETFTTGYRFRLTGSPSMIEVSIDDEFVRVHDLDGTDDVAVEIMLPHQRQFGFPNELSRRRPKLPPAPGTQIVDKKPSDLLAFPPRHPDRISPTCPNCHVGLGRACHFHAMAPRPDPLSYNVLFDDPLGFDEPMVAERDQARTITLRREKNPNSDAYAVTVEGATPNTPPNVAIFSIQRKHLLDLCRTPGEKAQVRMQYAVAVSKLKWSWATNVDVGYGYPLPLEPYKSYCAMHLRREHEYLRDDGVWVHHIEEGLKGRDFRKEFGDEFGVRYVPTGNVGGRLFYDAAFGPGGHTYRSWFVRYPDRSWAEHQDREEFLRAQVQERQFSPAQVHLEALTNLELLEDQRETPAPEPYRLANVGLFVEPAWQRTTRYDLFGAETDELPDEKTRIKYREFLSGRIEIEHNDTVVEVTEMQARYGIDYVQGSRGQTDPAIVFDAVEMPDDPMDPNYEALAAYVCHRHPEHRFSVEELDLGDFVCPICEGELSWTESGHEDLPARPARNIRGRTGIGHAMAQDRPTYMEQTRLIGLLCDHWQLKRSGNSRWPLTLKSLKR